MPDSAKIAAADSNVAASFPSPDGIRIANIADDHPQSVEPESSGGYHRR